MNDTIYVDHLARELEAATALASDEVKAALPALVRALSPALAQLRQDILVQCASDLNESGVTSGLYVRMTTDGPEFAIENSPTTPADFDDDRLVRMTLRLPEALRDSINAHIATHGGSLNSWLVTAATEKLSRNRTTTTKRLSGWSI